MGSPYHEPVMVEEVLQLLDPKPGGTYVDGTVGGAGHALEILKKITPGGRLIGIDRDEDALAESARRLAPFGTGKTLVKGNFADMEDILADIGIGRVDGILLDLGVSSHQLDAAERGFSFAADAPLDMRMDPGRGATAADLVNSLSEQELKKTLRDYGDEMMAGRIAKAIVARRKKSPVRTTGELADIILRALPSARQRTRIHPATRTFQALRIAVNDELSSLHRAVNAGTGLLKEGGRFVVVSFHSLEDRIVKNEFRSWEKGCICPPDFPYCVCRREARLRVLTRKPIRPSADEVTQNPRARSARLRAAERI